MILPPTAWRPIGVALLLLAVLVQLASAAEVPLSLRFVRGGETAASLELTALRERCDERTVEVDDPYYGARRRFLALPLEQVLQLGFGDTAALRGGTLLLRALDGYTRSTAADPLLDGGAYLAFADADRIARGEQGFDPIDRRQVDPAPFYVVWEGPGRSDVRVWPWPYQLATIELASFEDANPDTVPTGAGPGSPARRGYVLFQRQCAHCHAINGQGGKVGPDLNVPQSIVAYRPEAQIRAYIRNPQTFRYTSMPSHDLGPAELDQLLAYLRHMASHQRDPGPDGTH